MRGRVWFWIFVGSTIGGMVPSLWGAGMLSRSALLLSFIGAFAGLWVAFELE